jgi:predicted nucleic acid-binding protein
VIHRPELSRKYRAIALRDPETLLARLVDAEAVYPTEILPISRDPDDAVFFATAKAGKAVYIVSEDKDQIAVGTYKGITVVTAEQFLHILGQ